MMRRREPCKVLGEEHPRKDGQLMRKPSVGTRLAYLREKMIQVEIRENSRAGSCGVLRLYYRGV